MVTAPALERNVLVHEYEPRGTALALFHCRDSEVLVSGPGGTGKSRACLEKMLTLALINGTTRHDPVTGEVILDPDTGEPKVFRAFSGLFCRKTRESMSGTVLDTWRKFVVKEAIKGGLCVYYGGSKEEPAQYRFSNGSRIFISGLDNVTKIMGSEFDVIYVGEATECTPNDWEFLTIRLRNDAISFQQLIADCNPHMPTHWLKQRCDEGTTTIMFSLHWENPRYYDEFELEHRALLEAETDKTLLERFPIEEHDGRLYRITLAGVDYIGGKLEALTGVRKQRLRYGKWVAADGLVYENWNQDTIIRLRDDVLKPHTIPWEWPRWWVIDFGMRNPFVCQWWAEDPDGQLIMYREIYQTGRIVEDHARHMLRLVTRKAKHRFTDIEAQLVRDKPAQALADGLLKWVEPQPQGIICDHDAEDRATLTRHLDMSTIAAHKAVTPGLQAVEARLAVQANGRPGLVLMADAVVERDKTLKERGLPQCTAEEFPGYVWEPSKDGKPQKEVPLKENDHGMDCVRYIVAHRDLGLRIRDRDIWM